MSRRSPVYVLSFHLSFVIWNLYVNFGEVMLSSEALYRQLALIIKVISQSSLFKSAPVLVVSLGVLKLPECPDYIIFGVIQ